MVFNKTNRKNKFRLLLFLVFTLLFLSIWASFGQCFVNSRLNGYIKDTNNNNIVAAEDVYQKNNRDIKSFQFRAFYNTHDWIADSALRLIFHSTDADQKKYISWLLSGDSSLNLRTFDEEFDRVGVTYWNSKDDNFQRFLYFLKGTWTPDSKEKALFPDQTLSPRYQKILWSSTFGWHHVYFVYTDLDYQITEFYEIKYANDAANDCLQFLTQTGTPAEYLSAAMCVGGIAHFIGDLACIAHVSQEDQWSFLKTHAYIDRYASIAGKTIMTPNTYCELYGQGSYPTALEYQANEPDPYNYNGMEISGTEEWAGLDRWLPSYDTNEYFLEIGGPCWDAINPLTLKLPRFQGQQLGQINPSNPSAFTVSGDYLTPISAAKAAFYMAKLTISGWDDPWGQGSVYNLAADPKQQWNTADRPECGPYSAYRLSTLNYECDNNYIYTKFTKEPCGDIDLGYQ